jgi:hypothetical protein
MRLLANENLPRAAVEVLRSMGHDVLWMVRADIAAFRDHVVRCLGEVEHGS